ncbi:hypothetical protein JW964_27385 [candidate division KSB1 bacterium]|nr:hypothetical protein [candidate division KSB1 bacterium]
MLELSHKYVVAESEVEQNLLAAAGEAMLAKGAHGSMGAFPGFALPTIASILIAITMLKGKVFSKTTGYIGIFASSFMLIYLILVTFVPATQKVAVIFAMPGGLLSMTWMIMYMIRLFKLRRLQPH